jgi:Fe-S-cluster containining protein
MGRASRRCYAARVTSREATEAIQALHRRIDEQVRPLEALHAEGLVCARGCSSCCVDDITVFTVEAALIRHHHRRLLEEGEPHAPGACAFLDEEGACRIYPERPYVCRTQGLPLRWLDEGWPEDWTERRDICELNEPGVALLELDAEACWTLGPVESKLQALEQCVGAGLERVRLRDLFARHESRGDQEVSK